MAQTQSATSLRQMLRDPLGFVWRYALGYRPALEEEQPLTIDRRRFGELVHELLKRAVDELEPEPGYLRAAKHEIEEALSRAVEKIYVSWPLDRATPPARLWRHLLENARNLSLKALTLDEGFRPGTRSWTEAAFGYEQAVGEPTLPWNPRLPVVLGETQVRVRGRIDRLDLNADGHVRVSDYKTGAEPKNVERTILAGGAELQRAIYASAVRQLLGGDRRIVARLLYLGDDAPKPYRLQNVDAAIAELSSLLKKGRELIEGGTTLPGLDAWERWNEFRLAQPTNLASYRRLKQGAFAQAFGDFSQVWSTP
jgi:RecB family exonuclease